MTFETVSIDMVRMPPSVAICRLAGSHSHGLRVSDGWRYQSSYSETFSAAGSSPAASP